MQIQHIFGDKGTRIGRKRTAVSFLAGGVLFVGGVLLNSRFYIVSELSILLVFMAVLFSIVTGLLILAVLIQEGVRYSFRWMSQTKRTIPPPQQEGQKVLGGI